MENLIFPLVDFRVSKEAGKTAIFDIIRRKFIVLTPEEWVRQHVVHLLIDSYNYPKGLFRTEMGHTYNQLQKRTDVLIYNASGVPSLLVYVKCLYCKYLTYVFDRIRHIGDICKMIIKDMIFH